MGERKRSRGAHFKSGDEKENDHGTQNNEDDIVETQDEIVCQGTDR